MRRNVVLLTLILLSTGVLGSLSLFGAIDQGAHESCPLQMGFCFDALGHLSGFTVLFSSFIASLALLFVPIPLFFKLRPRSLRLLPPRQVRCVFPVRQLKWLTLLEKRDPEGTLPAGA